jgi:hypothetical protein
MEISGHDHRRSNIAKRSDMRDRLLLAGNLHGDERKAGPFKSPFDPVAISRA